jgi:hypothetical protein
MNTCRICYDEGTLSTPLHSACDCKGSVEFVHKLCIITWVQTSHKYRCEICKSFYRTGDITFETLYIPANYCVQLSQRTGVLYLLFNLFNLAYLTYIPTKKIGMMQNDEVLNILINAYNTLPYILCLVIALQGIVLIPAFMVVRQKYLYIKLLFSTSYVACIAAGCILSFYVPGFSTAIAIAIHDLYNHHSRIILQMNTRILKDSLLEEYI